MAPLSSCSLTHLDSFSLKMGRLKGAVKCWEKKKKGERKQLILDLNSETADILQLDSGLLSAKNSVRIKSIRERKGKYWAHEITSMLLKSRAL